MNKAIKLYLFLILGLTFSIIAISCGEVVDAPEFFDITTQDSDSNILAGLRLSIAQNSNIYNNTISDSEGKSRLPLRQTSSNDVFTLTITDADGSFNGGTFQTFSSNLDPTNFNYVILMEHTSE